MNVAIRRTLGLLAAAVLLTSSADLVTTATAQEPPPPAEALEGVFPARQEYSPYAGRNFPSRVFWGDTHLHTSASMDAGAFGNRLGFEDAYRFARGEELTASAGAAREAVAAARLPRRSPTTPTTWASSRGCSPANPTCSPTRPASGGTTWCSRARASRPRSRSSTVLARHVPAGALLLPGSEGYRPPGNRPSPPPRSTTSRAASPPSSATSGPRRCRPATICTAS